MTDVFSAINSRTSANNFDPTHVMTQAEITELAQLANQTPTSFNQQNWRLVAVNTPAAKARLKAAAYNQPKVGDAAVTFVLVGKVGGHKDLPVLIEQTEGLQVYWCFVNHGAQLSEFLGAQRHSSRRFSLAPGDT